MLGESGLGLTVSGVCGYGWEASGAVDGWRFGGSVAIGDGF